MTQTAETVRDTKDRILDAAESLFARQGFAATSLRQITAGAGVNLAAVNYHFQSKEALFVAVIKRKVEPINTRRLVLLDGLEARLPDAAPDLEQVTRAFFRPVFEARLLGVDLGEFPRLLGRLHTEPGGWAARALHDAFGQVLERFSRAFRRALPALTDKDLAWGAHFMTGAMAHYLAAGGILKFMARGQVEASDKEEAYERLAGFAAAGLRAMASGRGRHA